MTSLLISACPALAGVYSCVFSPTDFGTLTIKQKTQADVEYYSFKYSQIPGEPDETGASQRGVPDGTGWVVYCRDQKLVSISVDGSYKSEMYLARTRKAGRVSTSLVRYDNDVLKQDCPKLSK